MFAAQPTYLELLEDHTDVFYPAIAVLVLTLIALGVLAAWRSGDVDVIEKAELKRALLGELRKDPFGATAEQLAQRLAEARLKVARALEELEQQGLAESVTDTRRLTTWRLKGLTGGFRNPSN
jgi:hypothetical protein